MSIMQILVRERKKWTQGLPKLLSHFRINKKKRVPPRRSLRTPGNLPNEKKGHAIVFFLLLSAVN